MLEDVKAAQVLNTTSFSEKVATKELSEQELESISGGHHHFDGDDWRFRGRGGFWGFDNDDFRWGGDWGYRGWGYPGWRFGDC